MQRLAAAIADHDKTVAEVSAHKAELVNLQTQINELDSEITKLGTQLKDFDLANNSIVIEGIKDFANRKYRAKLEIETLSEIRDELKKKLPKMERDYSYLDTVSVSDSKRFCWSVLYDGLLKSIDVEPLKQLLAVGVAAGRHERSVMLDLNLTVEHSRLDALVKQFNLPI